MYLKFLWSIQIFIRLHFRCHSSVIQKAILSCKVRSLYLCCDKFILVHLPPLVTIKQTTFADHTTSRLWNKSQVCTFVLVESVIRFSAISIMAFENHELALSTYNDGFEKMSYISLELDAINCLEESIRCHETRPAENANHVSDRKFLREIELSERDNLSKQDSTRKSQPQKVNAGYILFDGSEIQYISTDKTGEPMVSKPPEKFSSDGSFHSRTSESSTRISELASHLTLSSNELFVRDSFRDTISRLSLTPYKRLPTNVHFSMLQKFYLLATGAAPVLTINTFYLSVAFLQPVLGNQVLSAIGG